MAVENRLSFQGIKTNSVFDRTNLVTIKNMARPYEDNLEEWSGSSSLEFQQLVDRIIAARLAGLPVIWSMGAHVIKNGLSRYIIELVRHGFLTHVSGNGATSIHDFELAFLGETSEDVARSIEDGSFGMWEETGSYMNEAVQQGVQLGLGYGASLYKYLSDYPEKFPYYDDCVFVQCQKYGVPYTCHISIGTDIIHQHPTVEFAALGAASGEDFRLMSRSVEGMQAGGVFLNFGSAISGPEIFLKCLALARNRGLPMSGITAANFDIVSVPAGGKLQDTDPSYHYRPRRVFIDRLNEIGGMGCLFPGLHQQTIPALFHALLLKKEKQGVEFPEISTIPNTPIAGDNQVTMFPVSMRNSRLHVEALSELGYGKESASTPGMGSLNGPEFDDFIKRLWTARNNDCRVLVSVGSNMVGSGVNRYLADLIKRGYITHLAVTGAACSQDIELAVCGRAEELEEGYLQAGKLGMWKEAGDILHRALSEGLAEGKGYGQSLIAYAGKHPQSFPYIEESLLGACARYGIPYTCHITIGTDDIQLHPDSNFAEQAKASGYDFQSYCHSVANLEGGVFINFGSAVTGPEVFLKALSISRNLQHQVHHITTANFDIVKLGDYSKKVGYEDWDYYYRPRKNIIHRPTSLGGKGFHWEGLHSDTVPAVWKALASMEKQAEGMRCNHIKESETQ
ncbi:deoxyhypusine synthase family protein [Paenibacillus radicis (ex Xue et al. 2023)]|uniref:Deoxyhypusine synthase family protein n=1 Tax=Paenibacillus radicis (ex Xue et al. 2023) TaxID=2972489 RepID=A0ABT1YM45_9BACL|nr:deoxyhypusine synthase family protein [Paenibacillus radicis (ex Xue et al. 2023)]MCR8634122.1 deoxyhypusine synthase family protein [Paenibacillus radicis (ex Xue et al. 2023)]